MHPDATTKIDFLRYGNITQASMPQFVRVADTAISLKIGTRKVHDAQTSFTGIQQLHLKDSIRSERRATLTSTAHSESEVAFSPSFFCDSMAVRISYLRGFEFFRQGLAQLLQKLGSYVILRIVTGLPSKHVKRKPAKSSLKVFTRSSSTEIATSSPKRMPAEASLR